jgi:hypothetical protein
MLLQAIPVLHFFSAQPEVFYAYIDEEKPGDNKKMKEGKEYVSATQPTFDFAEEEKTYRRFSVNPFSSPPLEYTTPPPDAC